MCINVYVYCHSHGACILYHIRMAVFGGNEATILEDGRDALSHHLGETFMGA